MQALGRSSRYDDVVTIWQEGKPSIFHATPLATAHPKTSSLYSSVRYFANDSLISCLPMAGPYWNSVDLLANSRLWNEMNQKLPSSSQFYTQKTHALTIRCLVASLNISQQLASKSGPGAPTDKFMILLSYTLYKPKSKRWLDFCWYRSAYAFCDIMLRLIWWPKLVF